jgi:hypothetical protein
MHIGGFANTCDKNSIGDRRRHGWEINMKKFIV